MSASPHVYWASPVPDHHKTEPWTDKEVDPQSSLSRVPSLSAQQTPLCSSPSQLLPGVRHINIKHSSKWKTCHHPLEAKLRGSRADSSRNSRLPHPQTSAAPCMLFGEILRCGFNTISLEEQVPGNLCAFFLIILWSLSGTSRAGSLVTEQIEESTMCIHVHVIFIRFKGHEPSPVIRGSLNKCLSEK